MNLTRKEIITYLTWTIFLGLLYLVRYLVTTWYTDYPLNYLIESTTLGLLLAYAENILAFVIILVAERRKEEEVSVIWILAGLVFGVLGFILYAAWQLMIKADLFAPEQSESEPDAETEPAP